MQYIRGAIDTKTKTDLENAPPKHLALLENLDAFKKGEKNNDKGFAQQLATLGDIYVNEARSANQEQRASLVYLPKLLPAYPGVTLFRELEFLQFIQEKKNNSLYFILGGMNLQKKILLLRRFIDHLSGLLLGGGIAYSFLHSLAIPVGNSWRERELEVEAFQLLQKADMELVDTVLPIDHLIAQERDESAPSKVSSRIPEHWMGMDLGPKTITKFSKSLAKAKNVLWYGPTGITEIKKFGSSSQALAKSLAKSKARVCAVGEDTTAVVYSNGWQRDYEHLEPDSDFVIAVLSKASLPGLTALHRD